LSFSNAASNHCFAHWITLSSHFSVSCTLPAAFMNFCHLSPTLDTTLLANDAHFDARPHFANIASGANIISGFSVMKSIHKLTIVCTLSASDIPSVSSHACLKPNLAAFGSLPSILTVFTGCVIAFIGNNNKLFIAAGTILAISFPHSITIHQNQYSEKFSLELPSNIGHR